MFFEYGQNETEYLSKRDENLGIYIKMLGKIEREMQPDLFCGVCMQLICQQISMRTALTTYNRLAQRLGGVITPRAVQDCEGLDGIGISARKADNIRFAANAVLNGSLKREALEQLPENEAKEELCKLPGVGPWTAEMLMLFTLGRRDVLSFGDYGIKAGMKKLYGKDEITKEFFEEKRKIYSPFGSTASLYLWEIAKL